MTIDKTLAGLVVSLEPRVQLLSVAHRHDVAIVDDIYGDWQGLAALVRQLPFEPALGAFPGLRVALRVRIPALDGMLARLLDSKHLLEIPDMTTFSLLAPLTDFGSGHHIPHRDAAVQISGVLYLCEPVVDGEGTGFYRHRSSGLHGVFQDDQSFKEAICRSSHRDENNFLRALAIPGPDDSIYGSLPSQTWELTHAVELRANRLVLFDARLFHAALAPRSKPTRLTQNLFLRGHPDHSLARFRFPH